MNNESPASKSISLASSNYTWDNVETRADDLGLGISKYVQQLIDLEFSHKLLTDYDTLKMIKTNGFKRMRRIINFLIVSMVSLLLLIIGILWVVRIIGP